MATGQGQGGGVFSWPDTDAIGTDSWAAMSGMHPGASLVGGRGGDVGYAGINVTGTERRVALGAPDPTHGAASGAPMAAHWRELFNLRGNPLGWVLIASIAYLGLAHVSLQGQLRGKAGKSGAGAGAGFKIG